MKDGRTRLARRRHVGPLVVQRPFHPEADGTAHVYLLHPPGGVAGGDRLEISCHLADGARALLTTPGAAKFYRTIPGRTSRARTVIRVGADAICEHLPQETILFSGASASIETRVELAPSATWVGWDFLSLGRPAAGEAFAEGSVSQRVEVTRGGRPIWFERLAVTGGSPLIGASFAFAGQPIVGTMVYAGPMAEGAAELIRDAVGAGEGAEVFSASQLDDVVVCRYLGSRMSEGKALFGRAREAVRGGLMGRQAVAPRIWAT